MGQSPHLALFTEESVQESILGVGCYYATKSIIKFMSLCTSVNIIDTCNSKNTIQLNQTMGVCSTCGIHYSSGVMVPLKYSLRSLIFTPLVIFKWKSPNTTCYSVTQINVEIEYHQYTDKYHFAIKITDTFRNCIATICPYSLQQSEASPPPLCSYSSDMTKYLIKIPQNHLSSESPPYRKIFSLSSLLSLGI